MRTLSRQFLSFVLAFALLITAYDKGVRPAQAFTVFDPANYSQNLLTAARSLEQINNQIAQLANDAQMLSNHARNLATLPTSVASELKQSLQQVDQLIKNARSISYDVSRIDRTFQRLFPEKYADNASVAQIVGDARETWSIARQGFQHALEVQAEVVGQVRDDMLLLDQLVASSQGAVGNLQAVQAGNQLTALAAKQSMQLQTLLAASGRAEALTRADALAAHERGQARFVRFVGTGSAYTRR